jgi:hypothetical protein
MLCALLRVNNRYPEFERACNRTVFVGVAGRFVRYFVKSTKTIINNWYVHVPVVV